MAEHENLIKILQSSYAKALFHQEIDPEVCILYARKFIEGVLKLLCYKNGIKKIRDNSVISDFQKILEKPDLPYKLTFTQKQKVERLRQFGNMCTHKAVSSKDLEKHVKQVVKSVHYFGDYLENHFEVPPLPEYSGQAPEVYLKKIAKKDHAELLKNQKIRSEKYRDVEDYETVLILWRRSINLVKEIITSGVKRKLSKDQENEILREKVGEALYISIGLLVESTNKAAHIYEAFLDFEEIVKEYENDYTLFMEWCRQKLFEKPKLSLNLAPTNFHNSLTALDRTSHRGHTKEYKKKLKKVENSSEFLFCFLPGLYSGGQTFFLLHHLNQQTLEAFHPIVFNPEDTEDDLFSMILGTLPGHKPGQTIDKQGFEHSIQEHVMHHALLLHFRLKKRSIKICRKIHKILKDALTHRSQHPVIIAVTFPVKPTYWLFYNYFFLKPFCLFRLKSKFVIVFPLFNKFTNQHVKKFLSEEHSLLSDQVQEEWIKQIRPSKNTPLFVYNSLTKKLNESENTINTFD